MEKSLKTSKTLFEKLWKDTPAVKEKEDRENKKTRKSEKLREKYSYQKDLENLKEKYTSKSLMF